MVIIRAGSRPSGKGPSRSFTGTVRIDPVNAPPEPSLVSFEPGARTAWHTHPLGQTLIGDVVWFPPREMHCHRAGQATVMSHIAVQEMLNALGVEQAADAQFQGRTMTDGKRHPARHSQALAQARGAKAGIVMQAVMQQFGYGDDAVPVSFEEIAPAGWTEKVYKPDILNGAGTLYEQLGYRPS